MRIPLRLLLAAAVVISASRSQQLLHDDFSIAPVDPTRWAVVTPEISSAVSVQGGECVLQDRGYLTTVRQFPPVAIGGIRVTGKFRFGGTHDYFSILTRCDAVPTGPFGNAQHGIAFDISWETAPHFFLASRGPQVLTGPTNWLGGGFQPVPGTDYTFALVDDGQMVRARIDGPNGQWAELELPILADTTTVKHVVFHNREPVSGSHLCYLDDVTIERLTWNLRWEQATPQNSPPSLRGVAMAFDRLRARTILFGGVQIDYPLHAIVGASAETWEWDGADWHEVATANGPSARFFHVMANDSVRNRTVLFGGRDATGANPSDTTWEYDGRTWTNVTPTTGPSPREVAGMVYDEARQQIVLFGGSFAGVAGNLDDTWTWNGTQWTEQVPLLHSPSGPFGHAMAYDATNARVLLFGGVGAAGYTDDLWQWDGSDWTELVRTTAARPPARHYHGVAFDPTRDQLLLFGGSPGLPPIGDTWTWSNNEWTQASTPSAPSARQYPAMVFDSVRREYVLFGGQDFGSGPHGNADDTWTYRSDDAWFATFGAGCPGSNNLTPTLAAGGGLPPVLGQTFVLEVNNLPGLAFVVPFFGGSITNDGPTTLPRDLTILGMTGCTQWVSVITTYLTLGVLGRAQVSIEVPNAPFLLGLHAYFQAAVWDQAANPLGVTASNAAAATIGW